MIKNADSLSLKTRGEVLHSAMPKQDKKNAVTCIFEPPQRAENPRETRVDVFRLLAVITIFWNVFQKVLIFRIFLDII